MYVVWINEDNFRKTIGEVNVGEKVAEIDQQIPRI